MTLTGKKLLELYDKGIPIKVKFREAVLDLDLQFETNMIADIESIKKNRNGLYEIALNEHSYKKFNKSLEEPSCYNPDTDTFSLKWSEKNERVDIVNLYIDEDELDNEIDNFEVIDGPYVELIKEYGSQNTNLSYLDWLQEKVLELKALYE